MNREVNNKSIDFILSTKVITMIIVIKKTFPRPWGLQKITPITLHRDSIHESREDIQKSRYIFKKKKKKSYALIIM